MQLQEWIDNNRLNAQLIDNICVINDKKFLIFDEEEMFDEDFEFALTEEHQSILQQQSITQVVFPFGNNWYVSNVDNVELTPFKYIDTYRTELDTTFPYLGVHGEYDLCNGTRQYKDWCKKAKFLQIPTLGICETNTLAGTLAFQLACKDAGIKSILGETITVKSGIETFVVKLYTKDFQGWINLLNINAQIKVFNEGYVSEEYLLSHNEGLICVLGVDFDLKHALAYRKTFGDDLYYQIDFVEWQSADKDLEHLMNLKKYLQDYSSHISPVLICDSFYLDKEDGYIKKILNSIGKVGFQNQSINQYFKPIEDIFSQIDELASNDLVLEKLFFQAIDNVSLLADKCNFEIPLGELHLPQYEMTQSEKDSFESNEDLFFSLLEKSLEERKDNLFADIDEYVERLEVEIEVIRKGGFIDYFLILWDIVNWCKTQDILTGVGRGSAAGSLVAYLLDITQVDPIQYGLLFERFLNEGRIGKSMPDIDTDFASDRRDDVKRYMENRYGIDYVTSIGTYGTFKIKSGIADLGREAYMDLGKIRYVTGAMPDDLSFTDLFKSALKTPVLKSFIQENFSIIESYPLLKDQVKTASIHAAGVIIVPKEYKGRTMTIYDWLPVKKVDGVLVTEWEGPVLETAGFLKEDILGTKQLQKLAEIMSLIKKHHDVDISLKDLPLDDQTVFQLFQGGYNEDVFQFGAAGLKSYCRELKPEVVDELIATVALYRPGPMESGAHKSFIKIKNGEKLPEYDYMLEDVTKETYSMYIYQESVMKAMQILGGFNLVQADDIRKAMGKKDMEKMLKYKDQFIASAVSKGCDQYEAVTIWNKLESFAAYGFNKSHATAYALTGYYCQWLKANYPLEFWSVALNFSDEKQIAHRIAEMHKISEVRVQPPDINKSTDIFECDRESNLIFWSVGSIKFVGEKALEAILEERNKGGKFFSFEDFYKRIPKRLVNKRCLTNLIVAGCFDQIEKIKAPTQRITLLRKFICEILQEELPIEYSNPDEITKEYFWILKQRELTGFGYFEFDKIFNTYISYQIKEEFDSYLKKKQKPQFVDSIYFQEESSIGPFKCVVGVIESLDVMNSKKGPFAKMNINCNGEIIPTIIWSEIYPSYEELLQVSKNKIIAITGKVLGPDGRYSTLNVLQTTATTQIVVL